MFTVNATAPTLSNVAPYDYSVFSEGFDTYEAAIAAAKSIKGATEIRVAERGRGLRDSWSFDLRTRRWSHKSHQTA